MTLSRRDFVVGAGALALGTPLLSRVTTAGAPAAGYDHVVVLMMENRSFDHYFGWLPGADGKQHQTYTDPDTGKQVATRHASTMGAAQWQGCGHPDPDHSATGGRVEYDGGKADGWLRAGSNDAYSIGYYTKADLPFTAPAATGWTTFSRYFAATLAETYPNRIYQHAGQTDRIHNTTDLCTLPTIWDRLAAAGRSGRYYFSDVPFLALWGPRYVPIGRPVETFFLDCAQGTLPEVAFVEPRFEDEDSDT